MSDILWADRVLLPYRPYATNHLERDQYRMSRDDALTMRYIEHSPHALLGSIVVDCDHPDAAMRAFEKPSDHPTPSWVAHHLRCISTTRDSTRAATPPTTRVANDPGAPCGVRWCIAFGLIPPIAPLCYTIGG